MKAIVRTEAVQVADAMIGPLQRLVALSCRNSTFATHEVLPKMWKHLLDEVSGFCGAGHP
jgi:hypothetical protein